MDRIWEQKCRLRGEICRWKVTGKFGIRTTDAQLNIGLEVTLWPIEPTARLISQTVYGTTG